MPLGTEGLKPYWKRIDGSCLYFLIIPSSSETYFESRGLCWTGRIILQNNEESKNWVEATSASGSMEYVSTYLGEGGAFQLLYI